MRTSTLRVTSLATSLATSLVASLAAAGLATASPVSAAGETCHGVPATVVGTPDQVGLTGTEGPDVVVTNGALSVSTLGGNDLVCITGGTNPSVATILDAGAGEDVVDASAATSPVDVRLGAGGDTYTGSPRSEIVWGGTLSPVRSGTVDTERDVITTGTGGDDSVHSGTFGGVANSDVVEVGAGPSNEVTWTGPMAPDGRLVGGGGASLAFEVGTGRVVVDANAGTLSDDDVVTLRWSGFDRYATGGRRVRAPQRFTFWGTNRAEVLAYRFRTESSTQRQHVSMAGGHDELLLGYNSLGGDGSTYAGGPGRDHVRLHAGNRLDLDLKSRHMRFRRGGRTVDTSLSSFERPYVAAKRLDLEGTGRQDHLRFDACKATVHGRGGADDVRQRPAGDTFEVGMFCQKVTFRLHGDGGDDVLRGGTGDDVLVGGRGRDRLDGKRGRDVCSGEKLKRCEVRRR